LGVPATDILRLAGAESQAFTGISMSIVLFVVWNRVLTDAEIAAFTANPWQMFQV
jgi:hypothetical protein